MKILCTICARKNSKGLINKNIKKINNKPLILYTIELAINAKIFDDIVVSSDDNRILKLIKKYNLFWLKRKSFLSQDNTPKIEVIRNALNYMEKQKKTRYDLICDLDVTTPLKNINDLIGSYKKFISKKYSNLFSVAISKKNPYFNMVEKKNKFYELSKKKNKQINRRQDQPLVYSINSGIYFWRRKTLLESNNLFNRNNAIYIMPEIRSIDIDTKFDFKIIEMILKNDKK
jgi:CMP-N,N'-diacetyllegionaminic acid synthase